jgi:predicted GIY-YIG superfamily endonuclease
MTYAVYHIAISDNLYGGYVGITKNLELRFSQHGWNRKQSNAHLRNALKKYGDKVKFLVIAQNVTFEVAKQIELLLRPWPNIGWNICKGGGVPPSPKGKLRSDEYRRNIAAAKMGDKNPMFGKKITFSETHRRRLSEAAKGRPNVSLKGVKRVLMTCHYCTKIGGQGAMQRWHFDRCKLATL